MTATASKTQDSAQLTFLVIAAAALFMVVFSATFLLTRSLRLDETQSLWQTSHSLIGVLQIIAQDVHVPLYFLMLRAWEALWGANALALRTFSLLFLVAALPFFYAFARQAYSRPVALLTVLLVATSPFLLWYGSEGRMYTLLLFLTVLNQLAYLKIWTEHDRQEYWWVYGVSAVCGAMTHYFFFFVLFVQAVFYLFYRELFPRYALKKFLLVAGVIGLEYGLWFVYRLSVGQITADPFLSAPTSIDVFNIFTNFFIGFQSEAINTVVLALWPIFVLLAFTWLTRGKTVWPQTVYLLLSAFVPIALAFTLSVTLRPMFLSRYLIVALPALYVLVAHALFLYRRQVAYVAATVLVLCMQGALFTEALSPAVSVNENYHQAAEYLTTHAEPDDLVVVTAPFTRYPMEYYYNGEARLATFPTWERYWELPNIPAYSETDLAQALDIWKGRYTNLYVLTSYDQGYEEQLRLYLDHHLERLSTTTFSPGLTLYVYRLRYL